MAKRGKIVQPVASRHARDEFRGPVARGPAQVGPGGEALTVTAARVAMAGRQARAKAEWNRANVMTTVDIDKGAPGPVERAPRGTPRGSTLATSGGLFRGGK